MDKKFYISEAAQILSHAHYIASSVFQYIWEADFSTEFSGTLYRLSVSVCGDVEAFNSLITSFQAFMLNSAPPL